MLNKLYLIIFKMSQAKRRYRTRNVLANIFVMFLLTIVLPSLLIFWTITEGRRSFTSGHVQVMEDDGNFKKENYNWNPLLEKIKDRKKSLATNCQYLAQHHKNIFSNYNENISRQDNNNYVISTDNCDSVICDVTGLTESLFCPSHENSVNSLTCPFLKREDVKRDDLSHAKNTFLVAQHPFKRIVSIFKSLSANRKEEIKKRVRFNLNNDNGAQVDLLFSEFVTFLLRENQWLPIQKSCFVCSTTFDYIINMENVQEEKDYLLYKTTGTDPPYQSIDSLEMLVPSDFEVNFYFSKLQKDMILRLYQLFRLDFELLNYKLNNYLSMGIDFFPPMRSGKHINH